MAFFRTHTLAGELQEGILPQYDIVSSFDAVALKLGVLESIREKKCPCFAQIILRLRGAEAKEEVYHR